MIIYICREPMLGYENEEGGKLLGCGFNADPIFRVHIRVHIHFGIVQKEMYFYKNKEIIST